jgi:glycine reductase
MNLVLPENLPRPDDFGYSPRLILRNEYTEQTAAQRSVTKLLAKIKGEPFESEVVLPTPESVEPPPPIEDPSKCEIALVSDGGLVP